MVADERDNLCVGVGRPPHQPVGRVQDRPRADARGRRGRAARAHVRPRWTHGETDRPQLELERGLDDRHDGRGKTLSFEVVLKKREAFADHLRENQDNVLQVWRPSRTLYNHDGGAVDELELE